MPALPTPQSAATARANPTFFGNLLHTFLTRAPYIGPLYNAGGTLVHAAQGTLGQWGRPTTPVGWLSSKIFPNIGQPSITPSAGGWSIDKDGNLIEAPAANPQGPVDPSDPNNPLNKTSAAPLQTSGAPAAAPPPLAKFFQQLYGTGRFPNSPAFSQTLSQAEFPGSAIGPLGGGIVNPYSSGDPNNPSRGDQGLGVIASHPTGIPPLAALLMAYNASRNQV